MRSLLQFRDEAAVSSPQVAIANEDGNGTAVLEIFIEADDSDVIRQRVIVADFRMVMVR